MSKQIRCILVDDEPPATHLLMEYARRIDYLEVIGIAHNSISAKSLLREEPVNLMFLDIRMPLINGLDFLKSLDDPPSVIVTTAYREYALEGYDLDIIDYLLKPISFERFQKSVHRYEDRVMEKRDHIGVEGERTVLFNVNRTLHRIQVNDICFLESLKDYTRIHLSNKNIVVKGNIGTTLRKINSLDLIRVHRSFAISIKKVSSFNHSEVNLNNTKVPLGSSYRNAILKMLKSNDL